jgi:hypothetical protein
VYCVWGRLRCVRCDACGFDWCVTVCVVFVCVCACVCCEHASWSGDHVLLVLVWIRCCVCSSPQCVYMCLCVCVSVGMCVALCLIYGPSSPPLPATQAHTYKIIDAHQLSHSFNYKHANTYTHTITHIHIYTDTHTPTHTPTHTRIHMHTHTGGCIPSRPRRLGKGTYLGPRASTPPHLLLQQPYEQRACVLLGPSRQRLRCVRVCMCV